MRKYRGNPESKEFGASSERGVASLKRALHTEFPNEEQEPLPCAECRLHFAALYHKLQTETPLTELEQASMRHLTTCPDCAAEFEALRSVMAATANGTLPELMQPYEFDLSFLTPTASPSATPTVSPSASPATMPDMPPSTTGLWTRALAARLWNLVDEVQIGIQASRATFASLPLGLVPTTTTGAVMRAEGHENQLEEVVLPIPDAAVHLHLAVGPLVAGKAVVTVKLVNTDNAQPLQNALVALRNSHRQLLLGCTSGEDGCAILEPLARGRYFIQIQSNHQTWEVPLNIVGGSPLD